MSKPILFHDIDGVLFGEYDGEFQLRPGVKTWLKWAHEHYEVVWLTSWNPEKIKTLLSVLYCEQFTKHLPNQQFQYANWMNYSSKVVWLSEAIPKLRGREWLWIDDDVESLTCQIAELGVPMERCVQVCNKGPNVLQELSARLDQLRGVWTNVPPSQIGDLIPIFAVEKG